MSVFPKNNILYHTFVYLQNRDAPVLNSWGSEVLEEIEEVSIDLWKGYKTLIKKLMPNVQLVADRFHVMVQVNNELDTQRKREIRLVIDLSKKSLIASKNSTIQRNIRRNKGQ